MLGLSTVVHRLVITSIVNQFLAFQISANQKRASKILFSDWLLQILSINFEVEKKLSKSSDPWKIILKILNFKDH
jgi:hypothetical protein